MQGWSLSMSRCCHPACNFHDSETGNGGYATLIGYAARIVLEGRHIDCGRIRISLRVPRFRGREIEAAMATSGTMESDQLPALGRQTVKAEYAANSL